MNGVSTVNSRIQAEVSAAVRETAVGKKAQQVQAVEELSKLQLIESASITPTSEGSRVGSIINIRA